MQSDTPQSDPRLQRTNPGPKVAAGYIDPCIVYLETTLPGEIPVLYICWAQSSVNLQKPGGKSLLRLDGVVVQKWRPIKSSYGWLMHGKKPAWNFVTYRDESLLLTSQGSTFSVQTSERLLFVNDDTSPLIFQGSIRFIDQKTEASLRKLLGNLNALDILARKILECAQVDWQSISDALASLNRMKVPKARNRKSLFRRLISSVFRKKQKPVAA
jgi:hypothetical protein